jgi:hypothetical protein
MGLDLLAELKLNERPRLLELGKRHLNCRRSGSVRFVNA